MSRFLNRLVLGAYGVLILHAIFSNEPDDPLTAGLKSAGLYWWVMGFLITYIAIAAVYIVIGVKKLQRMEEESRDPMYSLRGAELVKYLVEKKGWGKK